MGALLKEYEAHKPFYPEEIYESIRKLHRLSWTKLFLQADKANIMQGNTLRKTVVDMLKDKNQSSDAEGISETIDMIYVAIRKRVQYWEEFRPFRCQFLTAR